MVIGGVTRFSISSCFQVIVSLILQSLVLDYLNNQNRLLVLKQLLSGFKLSFTKLTLSDILTGPPRLVSPAHWATNFYFYLPRQSDLGFFPGLLSEGLQVNILWSIDLLFNNGHYYSLKIFCCFCYYPGKFFITNRCLPYLEGASNIPSIWSYTGNII